MKTKAIPTADSDALRDALAEHHQQLHTPEGLHDFDGPRRQLIDQGIKGIAIATELVRRGSIPTPCTYCLPCVTMGGRLGGPTLSAERQSIPAFVGSAGMR